MTTPLKRQVLTRASGDATLIAMLGDGADSVYPRAAADPDAVTTAPFVVLRMGAETPTSEITARQFFTWYIYDDRSGSGWGYWRIDRIIDQLRALFDGYESFTFDGRYWGRCTYDGTSEEQADDDWNKLLKTARFSVPRV